MGKDDCINSSIEKEVKSDSTKSTLKKNDGVFKPKIFVQTVNPTLGKLEWQVQDEDYDYTQEVARSAYGDMLHDDERNELYYAGLRDAVTRVQSRGDTARVLDIGTGTGLLSMMAVRCGADSVIACEAFEPMAQCAEKILAANNMTDKVRVIHKRSTELTVGGDDLPERANILVAEVFDTELIGEGAISTYSHAREHLLTEDALLVPSAGRVFAQVVSSPELHSYSKPHSYVPHQFRHLRLPASLDTCPGTISLHDVQMSQLSRQSFTPVSEPIVVFEFDWSGRTIPLTNDETNKFQFTPLSSSVDNDTKANPNEDSSSDGSVEKTNACHAVFMWWDLTMDQVGDVMLTCAPHWLQDNSKGANTVPWRDHWMQAVYHLPPPLASPVKGAPLTLSAVRDEYSMWFAVNSHPDSPSPPAPHCSCGVHISTTSRGRLSQLSDQRRLTVLSKTIERTITLTSDVSSTSTDDSSGAWLILGDCVNFLLIGQLAADRRVSQLYIHETCRSGRRSLAEFVDVNGFQARVTVLPADLTKLTPGLLKHEISTVFSEPFFRCSHLPWHNLRGNVLLNELASILPELPFTATPSNGHQDSKKVPCDDDNKSPDSVILRDPSGEKILRSISLPLMTSATVLPGKMSLYCLPVSFFNLWKIRAPCQQRCGFDLTIFDELIDSARCNTDDYMEAQPLWEYPCYALHTPIHLVTLDLASRLSEAKFTHQCNVALHTETLRKCAPEMSRVRNSCFGSRDEADESLHYNGVAVWAEWDFGGGNVLSTGPLEKVLPGEQVVWEKCSLQGVHLPRNSVSLLQHKHCHFQYSFTCDKLADITFTFNVKGTDDGGSDNLC